MGVHAMDAGMGAHAMDPGRAGGAQQKGGGGPSHARDSPLHCAAVDESWGLLQRGEDSEVMVDYAGGARQAHERQFVPAPPPSAPAASATDHESFICETADVKLLEAGAPGTLLWDRTRPSPCGRWGRLTLTSQRILFCPAKRAGGERDQHAPVAVPRGLVYQVQVLDRADEQGPTGVVIWTKTGETVRLQCQVGCPAEQLTAVGAVPAVAPITAEVIPDAAAEAWPGAEAEWRRMGVDLSGQVRAGAPGWRLSRGINANYATCASYPSAVVVPAAASDESIKSVAAFRTSSRFPALSWRCPKRRIAICRSSQPCTAALGCDSHILDLIAAAEGGPPSGRPQLVVIDCRSATAAHANRLKGGGTEAGGLVWNSPHDGRFCDMGNIHEVRDAFENAMRGKNFLSWAEHAQRLYVCACQLAQKLAAAPGTVALVHCSDGWDRTSQLVALAQILLDDRARTAAGFAAVVRREFLAFGHRFASRNKSGGRSAPGGDQTCPVWLQFLDVVGRFVQRYPALFGFTSAHLRRLAHESLSGNLPAFLYDRERDRQGAAAACTEALEAILSADLPQGLSHGRAEEGGGIALLTPCDGLYGCADGPVPPSSPRGGAGPAAPPPLVPPAALAPPAGSTVAESGARAGAARPVMVSASTQRSPRPTADKQMQWGLPRRSRSERLRDGRWRIARLLLVLLATSCMLLEYAQLVVTAVVFGVFVLAAYAWLPQGRASPRR
eukprot:TRINITY_DN65315_c0_g1_i1.p1 TRINITY_DN65315_c0_g1~~TRINITY_DN65315_c0_g1_i1.p1  ORF type:complete len:726 (+),score=146.98 TRINITY_DN65315_c0_g1_i1:127-2304(+)